MDASRRDYFVHLFDSTPNVHLAKADIFPQNAMKA